MSPRLRFDTSTSLWLSSSSFPFFVTFPALSPWSAFAPSIVPLQCRLENMNQFITLLAAFLLAAPVHSASLALRFLHVWGYLTDCARFGRDQAPVPGVIAGVNEVAAREGQAAGELVGAVSCA